MKDLHIHTIYSDGEYNEFEILDEIKNAGIDEFAICDHDTIEGSKRVYELVKDQSDLKFHSGVELTCRFNDYSEGVNMHILVHDFDYDNKLILEVIEEANALRSKKIDKMVTYIENEYNIKIPREMIAEKLKTTNSFGKPHLYSILTKLGDFDREKYYRTMNKLSTAEFKLDVTKTLTKLKGVGKIILAHPIEIMKEYDFNMETIEDIIIKLKKLGLDGVETYHSSQTKEVQSTLSQIANKYSLIESQGSDYHGPKVKPGLKLGTIQKI